MTSTSPLRSMLANTMAKYDCTMKDLTVLATQNDPFRIDTPAGHRDGEWLAVTVRDLGLGNRKIHLRGLHYMVLGRTKPNGEIYSNTAGDWSWIQEKAADAARWLGYIEFDQIIDRRNASPVQRIFQRTVPRSFLSVGIDVEIPDASELEPYVGVMDFAGVQPYKLVMIGEKSSLEDVLAPIAQTYKADLYLPTGEPSDTMLYHVARIGAEDGRPMVVLYFSDCDPAGWQMPISAARKLQAFKALGTTRVATDYGFDRELAFGDLEFEVYRVALTPDQVREYGLPSAPLKATEKRADRWQHATGIQQTEIDALASLQPDLLRRIAEAAIAPFYDNTLDRRVIEAKSRWLDEAQEIVTAAMDSEHLDRIRTEADEKLAELRDQIDAINDELQVDADEFDLPELIVPTAQTNGGSNGLPLLDSRWPFAEQCHRLIDSKAYRGDRATA